MGRRGGRRACRATSSSAVPVVSSNGNGVKLIDAGGVPEPYRPTSRAGCDFSPRCDGPSDPRLDVPFASAEFIARRAHGVFRLGADAALRDAGGAPRSWISYEDYAVHWSTRSEQPRHSRCRFTVGYCRALSSHEYRGRP